MGLWADFKHTLQHTYVADGVDLIDETQNDSQEYFRSEDGLKYRNHWGTILLHMFGFPTRNLTLKAGPSLKNLGKNWIGYNPASSTPMKWLRGILMGLIVNPILLIPRAVVGIAKIVTEVIPGTISRFLLNTGEDIVETGKSYLAKAVNDEANIPEDDRLGAGWKIGYGAIGTLITGVGGIFWGAGALVKTVYLTLCTLTSPIETVRSSYHYGKNPIDIPFTQTTETDVDDNTQISYKTFQLGKPAGFVLAGLAVVGSFITFALTGPFAIKALAAALAPIAGGRISNAVLSVEKIGNVKFIGPILTKIGEGFQKVISLPYISNVFNFLRIGPTLQATPAAIIGLGAVVGGLLASVGTLVSEYAYKPWLRHWHDTTAHKHTGLVSGGQYHPLEDPLANDNSLREDLGNGASSHVRAANKNIGEGSGTRPFFASPATVSAATSAPTSTAANDDKEVARYRV